MIQIETSGNQAVWLPTDVSEAEAERLITDDNWCAQVKEDGIHVLAASVKGRIDIRNRKGEPHPMPDVIKTQLADLPNETLLDGEKLHSGILVVFDILYLAGEDLRKLPYQRRFEIITGLCVTLRKSLVVPVLTAFGTKDKRKMVETVRAARGEGVIFKDLRVPYRPGRPAEGGSMRRLKFRKSLTCILQRRPNDTKASFEMYLMDGQEPVNIGSVSAQQYFDGIAPGEIRIGEVTYLYATPSKKVVQPVLLRPVPWRDDKVAEECTIDQLVQGGRFAQGVNRG